MEKNTSETKINIPKLIKFNHNCLIEKDFAIIHKLPKGPTIKIPKEIVIHEDFAWLIGFYLAEGNKVKYGIGFSNSEIELVNRSKEIFNKYFGFNNSKWVAFIRTRRKRLKIIKNKYNKKIKVGKIIVYHNKKVSKDNLEFRINNVPFALIFSEIIKKSVEIISENKNLILAFLDGYEVGDGSIIRRNEFLYGIVITVKNIETKRVLEKMFIKIYKKKPRIRGNKGSYELGFADVNLMTEFILDHHFGSSKIKWEKFIKSYLKKQYTRSHIRYWLAIKNKELSVREISRITNRSHWSVRDAMKLDSNFNLVKIRKGRIQNKRGGPYHVFYSLSNKGKKLLNILEEV